MDPDQADLAVGQGDDVEGARHLEAPANGPGDLDLG
jgi:hypothetical protein